MTAVVAVVGSIVVAQNEEESPRKDDLIFASAGKAKFKEVSPGISKAAVWGDEEKGPYGAFTKFKPGLDNGMHTHTNDIWVVGIKGAYVYRDEAGEKRVTGGISFGFRVEKSIGAAATRKRVRCSMKNHLANSTLCPRSRTTLPIG